jgi:hypothetical protein
MRAIMMQQVFVSYRHENGNHARTVRRLGELLRQAKIPVALDQFLLDELPGGPDSGWPKWCEDCAIHSASVLIIASEGWFAAYNKDDAVSSGMGLGAASEADLFRQAFYDEKGHNQRVRLVFLSEISADKVPVRLRAWNHFRPFESGDQMDALIRWIAQRIGMTNIELPTVRWPDPLPFRPDIANRTTKEWPALVEMLSGRSRKRILLYEGESGIGKSALVRQALTYTRKINIPVVHVDFKGGGLDILGILGQFYLDLGRHLPSFSKEGADKTHLLRKDLRALRQPVLVVFDTYEDAAGNRSVSEWLNLQFLPEVETALGLAVIVAGQRVPDYGRAIWGDLALHLRLSPITEIEQWQPWIEQRYPEFKQKGAHLPTLLMIANGIPLTISGFCEAISKS